MLVDSVLINLSLTHLARSPILFHNTNIKDFNSSTGKYFTVNMTRFDYFCAPQSCFRPRLETALLLPYWYVSALNIVLFCSFRIEISCKLIFSVDLHWPRLELDRVSVVLDWTVMILSRTVNIYFEQSADLRKHLKINE